MKSNRINKVVEKMKAQGLDHLLITDPVSIDYLLEYENHPGERMYIMDLASNGQHRLFFNILFYVERDLGMPITWFSDTDDSAKLLSDHLQGAEKIGVDKNMAARFLLPVMQSVDAQFVLGSSCVDEVRMQKDEEEKALMIKASEMNDEAMGHIEKLLATNKTEKEMEDALTKIYKSLGSTGDSFDAIIGYGPNGANPHHFCDDSRLKPGDSIIVDMGCIYQGYCSDMTRTFFYQEVSEEQRKVYELVLAANKAAEAAIKPGVKLSDIDAIARDLITKAGYGKEFNHRLGHFIGRDVHEFGDVSSVSEIIAKEGMVFSIEPGIYLKDDFGVRIEDLVMVTKEGCKVLNHYSKELTIIK